LAAALLAGGCAPGFGGGAPDSRQATQSETMVRVRNYNWADITVYAVRNGTRVRLGTVTSMREEVFTIPRAIASGASDLRLLADPIGSSRTYWTDALVVSPGQTVDLTLENNIDLSSYAIW
jgi:hypothetical protein